MTSICVRRVPDMRIMTCRVRRERPCLAIALGFDPGFSRTTASRFRVRLTQFGFGVSGGIDAPLLPSRFQGDNFDYTGNAQYDFIVDLERYGWLEGGPVDCHGRAGTVG